MPFFFNELDKSHFQYKPITWSIILQRFSSVHDSLRSYYFSLRHQYYRIFMHYFPAEENNELSIAPALPSLNLEGQ